MKGRKQIVRMVKTEKESKDGMGPARGLRARNGHPQGKQKEANARHDDCKGDAPGERIQFSPGLAEERSADVKEVDRHVGDDHHRDKRDVLLEGVIPAADMQSMGSDPVASAVNDNEKK